MCPAQKHTTQGTVQPVSLHHLQPEGLSVPYGEPWQEVQDVPPSEKPDPRRNPVPRQNHFCRKKTSWRQGAHREKGVLRET